MTDARKPRSQTTIKEIARLAGVSIATVSRVINDPDQVREGTRGRVLSVIREYHFVADRLAGGLRSQRSRTIGLIIPTIANSIYASSTQAIQEVAQARGYTVFVGVTDYSAAAEVALIHRLIEHRIDGLILTGADRDKRIFQKITHNRVPFVVTWQLTHSPEEPTISFDNYSAAKAATEHLISLGHRRIGLVCGRTALNDRAFERRRAYEECLAEHGLTINPRLIHECDFEMSQGRAAMSRMIALKFRPTAVFCANDVQAVGAIAACNDANLRVPDDMSIMGFDDLPIAECTIPPLTTIRVPAYQMGKKAAEALIGSIKSKHEIKALELPTEMIVRQTTGTPPSGRINKGR